MKHLGPGEITPLRIAHRGDSANCPENTVAAFDAAMTQPIDGIELDLQLSRDGIPVVYHDRTLGKAGAGGSRVEALDLEELRALDLGAWFHTRFAGERILTLPEVLERYGGRTLLLLEIKARREHSASHHHRLAERTVDAVQEHGLEGGVLLLSFDAGVLQVARSLAPRLPTVQNLGELPRTGGDPWEELEPLHALSVDARVLTPRFVEEAHRRNKPVLTYTCNTSRSALRVLDAGVDGIMTDRPAWLAGFLAESSQRGTPRERR